MKTKVFRLLILAIFPAALLLTGCWTNPYTLQPATGEPAFVGGMVVVSSSTVKATVVSLDIAKRMVVLQFKNGSTTTNLVGPQAVNLNKVQVGDTVKADISGETAIFIVKNGALPAAGFATLTQHAPKGAEPAGVVVTTHDYSARVVRADRSYRLLSLEYADGSIKTFKVPLPFTLEHVVVGDDVVVRTTDTLALEVTPVNP